MLTTENLKDLVIFNAFKAMQMEMTAAHWNSTAKDLAGQLDKARQELNPTPEPMAEAVPEAVPTP